jgi:spore coat protein U-like protein
MNTTSGSTDCRQMAAGRRRGSRLAWLSLMLAAGACMSAQAIPTCTIASGATLSFGAVVALASTGDVTTNSGSSFWVNCTSDVAAAPALYSSTPRTLLSGGNSLPFALSLVSPGGASLPTISPGTQLGITRNGSNQMVTLYGKILATNFQSLSPGMYSTSITLTLEY